MKYTYTDKKVKFPDSVHDYAKKKFSKLDKFFQEECDVSATFSLEREQNKVEVTVRSGGMIFRVTESTSDMYASIDAALSSIERQIRKNKTRLAKRLRKEALEDFQPTDFVREDEPEPEFKIVRTKVFSMKPMTRDEAILQMNLLGHTFFAFRDEEYDDHFAIVYVRRDGGYGLIEDEGK